MSPEQARGRPVDKRADLWAFGAVLYEMLTGRRAFDGEHVSDTLTRVLTKDPDWSALPADTPAPVRRLLRRCLEKDRKRRLDSAAAARLEIDDAIASPHGETLALAAAPCAARHGGDRRGTGWRHGAGGARDDVRSRDRPSRRRVFTVAIRHRRSCRSADQRVGPGSRPRAVAGRPASRLPLRGHPTPPAVELMVRAMDQLAGRPLTNVVYAYAPFFSPDGRVGGVLRNGVDQEGRIARWRTGHARRRDGRVPRRELG